MRLPVLFGSVLGKHNLSYCRDKLGELLRRSVTDVYVHGLVCDVEHVPCCGWVGYLQAMLIGRKGSRPSVQTSDLTKHLLFSRAAEQTQVWLNLC